MKRGLIALVRLISTICVGAWRATPLRDDPPVSIIFADSVGIEYKVQQILNDFPDLGGVAIWGIGGEDPANWEVLRTARQANCTT